MAFTESTMALISGGFGDGTIQLYGYKSADTKATISASGYFDSYAPRINVGDRIVLGADTGGTFDAADLYVATNSGGVVTTAEVSDAGDIALAEGFYLVGDSSGDASAVDGATDKQILVGDGTTLASVAVSGDVTIANTGAVTIATGAVEDSMIEGLAASEFILGVDGTAANNAKVVMSGDGTLTTAGVLAVATNAIEPAMIDGEWMRQGYTAYVTATGTVTQWAINTHAKVRLESISAQLVELPSATATFTIKLVNGTGTVDMTDTVTFTQGVDVIGEVKILTPVTAADADELEINEKLDTTAGGTTSGVGEVLLHCNWIVIDS